MLNFFLLVWNTIRPKLERMLQEQKESTLAFQRSLARESRFDEFAALWNVTLASIPADQQGTMPTYADVVKLPTVVAMIEEADAQLPVTKERWNTFRDAVMLEVEQCRRGIQRNLVALLRPGNDTTEDNVDTRPNDSGENNDLQILSKPSSLFTCFCRKLLGYSTLMDHARSHARCTPLLDMLHCESLVPAVVSQVMNVICLPDCTTLRDLEKLGEKFICACGHPAFRKPVTFIDLVRLPDFSRDVYSLIFVFVTMHLG
jgi:hypothetical protein